MHYSVLNVAVVTVYINHRPVFGLEEQKLKWAFEVLGVANKGLEGEFSISREDLLDLLQNHGENMHTQMMWLFIEKYW